VRWVEWGAKIPRWSSRIATTSSSFLDYASLKKKLIEEMTMNFGSGNQGMGFRTIHGVLGQTGRNPWYTTNASIGGERLPRC
jgi:hypothetical protein